MSTQKKTGRKIGGVEAVADMLNHMTAEDRQRLLTELAKRDGKLTAEIESKMFVFDHIAQFDDPSIQFLLREVPKELLALALRSASEEVKEALLRNLSGRAKEMLRDEMDTSAPRKISEVEAAQAKIVSIAKALAAEGKLHGR